MEKYSKHLEILVGERTQGLVQEKERADQLLYSKYDILNLDINTISINGNVINIDIP